MIDEKMMAVIYPLKEYSEYVNYFAMNSDTAEERFLAWVTENKTQLTNIFKSLITESDPEALNYSYVDWTKKNFICWDYNTIQTNKINAEIEDMLNGF